MDPDLGWKGGMRPVIKLNTGRGIFKYPQNK
jgi:hypothetical protein